MAKFALRLAVRRWPAPLRAEMAAEWAAELHAISELPDASRPGRAWRALTFTVSLACARPPDGEEGPGTVVGSVLRRHWKPVVVLALAPAGMLVASAVTLVVPAIVGYALLGDVALMDPSTPLHRGMQIVVAMIIPAVVLLIGVLAGRLAQRYAHFPDHWGHGVRAWWVALLLGAGMMALHGLLLPTGLADLISSGVLPAMVATAIWTAGFAVVGWATAAWRADGRRRAAGAVAVVGGLVVLDLALTAHIAVKLAPFDPPLAYAPLWFPASLVNVLPTIWLGSTGQPLGDAGVDSDSVAFILWDSMILYPYLLLALGGFGLTYLASAAARSAVQSPDVTSASVASSD